MELAMNLSRDELEEIVSAAVSKSLAECVCFLSDEEKQIVKDVAEGGKTVKQWTIKGMLLALFALACWGAYILARSKGLIIGAVVFIAASICV